MASPSPRGRPRDPDIDAKVLEVARQLLAEEGFTATTVQEISRRSGIHAPAIYRRWPCRLALIEHAAVGTLREVDVTPTGELRHDLRRFLEAYERTFSSPVARAAMPWLLDAYQRGAAPQPGQWEPLSMRPLFEAVLRAAEPGLVDPDLATDDVFDVLLGAMLVRALVPATPGRDRDIETTIDLLLRLVRPDR